VIRCANPEALLLVPLAVMLLRARLWPRAGVAALRAAMPVTSGCCSTARLAVSSEKPW
jgi:hypothetical protein